MKIAILGSGGREHAIADKISKSPKINKLFCIPGNAGTENIAENINLDISNFNDIAEFIEDFKIDLVLPKINQSPCDISMSDNLYLS